MDLVRKMFVKPLEMLLEWLYFSLLFILDLLLSNFLIIA